MGVDGVMGKREGAGDGKDYRIHPREHAKAVDFPFPGSSRETAGIRSRCGLQAVANYLYFQFRFVSAARDRLFGVDIVWGRHIAAFLQIHDDATTNKDEGNNEEEHG